MNQIKSEIRDIKKKMQLEAARLEVATERYNTNKDYYAKQIMALQGRCEHKRLRHGDTTTCNTCGKEM